MNATIRQATTPRLHAGAPQRPRGQRDPAGAGGGEQPRGRQPGHRDLVALAPADPRSCPGRTPRGTARRSRGTSSTSSTARERQPPRVAVLDAVPGVLAGPGSFGSTKYRNATAETTNRSETEQPPPREQRRRGISSLARRSLARARASAAGRRRLGLGVASAMASCSGASPPMRSRSARSTACSAPMRRADARRGRGRRARTASASARRRADRRRSARRDRRAQARASARRSSPRRRPPGPPRTAGGRPSATWRSAATAWQRADFLQGHRRGHPSGRPRTARRTRSSSGARRACGPSSSAPRAGRVPRRRGRDRPVEHRAEVEHGVHPRGGAREALGLAPAAHRRRCRAGRRTTPSGTTPAPARSG